MSEAIGNEPPRYVFIEPDREMEGLDNLRACGEGFSQIKLDVLHSDFSNLLRTGAMHAQAIFEGMPLSIPTAARQSSHLRERMDVTLEQTIENRQRLTSIAF